MALTWDGPEGSIIGQWVDKPQPIKIVECTRCKAPQVFKDAMKDSEIPVALEIDLNGGYGMFIDNWQDRDEYHWLLCHKCAHEFVNWVGINMGHGHPNTDEPFCNGWRFDDED